MYALVLTLAGALVAAIAGALANWVVKPKWAEHHPRRVVGAVVVLALVAGAVTYLAQAAAAPGTSTPPEGTTPPTPPVPATQSPGSSAPGSTSVIEPGDLRPGDGGTGAVPGGGGGGAGGGGGTGGGGGSGTGGGPQIVPPVDPLRVTTTALPPARVGERWTATLTAGGGTGPYRWTVTGGAVPTGFVLQPDGRFNGTATSPRATTFTVTVEDERGATASRRFNLAPQPRRSDITNDGPVDCADKAILDSQWNQTGDLSGDINGDGTVNITDLSIMMNDWTSGSTSC